MDSNLLRIGRSNLENLNSEIRDANLKKKSATHIVYLLAGM